MTDAPAPTPATTGNAYELLSKPIAEITDAELELIVTDLRRRRAAYQAGKADAPARAKKAPTTAEEKAANTAQLLGELNLDLGGLGK